MTKKLFALFLFLTTVTSAFAFDEPRRQTFIYAEPGRRVFIGAGLINITPELREFFGAPKDAGVLVASLTENGPAAKAGLRVGDVITAIDGTPVSEYFDLTRSLRAKHGGDSARIDVVRAKQRQTLVANVEERDVREFSRAFSFDDMQHNLQKLDGTEWKALLATPDNDDLRARIHELEDRLQKLEKKLQQK